MADLIYCELLKLKRSKMILISILGALAAPAMLLLECLQTHFEHPEKIITLAHIYDSLMLYTIILMNLLVYIIIASYLFSREYTEKTLKNILPIPVSRTSFLTSKFCILFVWMIVLSFFSWGSTYLLALLYHSVFGMAEFHFHIALTYRGNMLIGTMLMFLTITPFTFLAEKTKSLVVPLIISSAVIMGNAALSNQDLGALYPWTAILFLMQGSLSGTGYPVWTSVSIIALVSILGFAATFIYFQTEDIK